MLTKDQLNIIIREFSDQISIGAFIGDQSVQTVNTEKKRTSASLIKPFILYYLLKKGWDLEMKVPLNQIELTEDTILRFFSGSTLTISGLISLMIDVSDNSVSNYFLDRIGIQEINDFLGKEGFQSTCLERKFLDLNARAQGHENRTSVSDLRKLYHGVLQGKLLEPDSSDFFVRIMKTQFDRSKLAYYLPESIGSGGKSGVLEDVWNDLIFFGNLDRPAMLIALTEDLPPVVARDLLSSYSYHFVKENFHEFFK